MFDIEDHGLEMPKMDAAYWCWDDGARWQVHEQSIELLVLSSTLDPKNQFKKFDIDKIYQKKKKMCWPLGELFGLDPPLDHHLLQMNSKISADQNGMLQTATCMELKSQIGQPEKDWLVC